MNTPQRVQLSRKKGFRLPENTVVVSRPSRWGNPFRVCVGRTQAEAVRAFRAWLTLDDVDAGIPDRKRWILEHILELRGKNLACWCPPGTPCHAEVLIEMANTPLVNRRMAELREKAETSLHHWKRMREDSNRVDHRQNADYQICFLRGYLRALDDLK